MKKNSFIFIFILFSLSILSNNYNYSFVLGGQEMGSVYFEVNEEERILVSSTELKTQGSAVIYKSTTIYAEDWKIKSNKLEIFVDGVNMGILNNVVDKNQIKNNFMGVNLKNYTFKDDFIILDNNVMMNDYFILMNKNIQGQTNIFIPQMLLNAQTQNMAFSSGNVIKTENKITVDYLGLQLIVEHENNIIKSVKIPSQSLEVKLIEEDKPIAGEVEVAINNKEVTIKSFDDFVLNGTLSYPELEKGKKYPAILFVHGSGPNDRNTSMALSETLIYKPFEILSNDFVKRNFVTLRYDKRTFTIVSEALDYENVQVEDFVKDAAKAVNYLRSLDYVDYNKIIVIGHSQGGSFLKQIDDIVKIDYPIALAPGIIPILDLLKYQMEYQLDYLKKNNINDPQSFQLLNMILEEANHVINLRENEGLTGNESIMGQNIEFFINWEKLNGDIIENFKKFESPVLIINGKNDLKTPYELLKNYESSLSQKNGLEIKYIENMTHELLNIYTYDLEKSLIESIINWLDKNMR